MSKERLSKLQKIILQIISDHGGHIDRKNHEGDPKVKDIIYPNVLKLYGSDNRRSVSAAISRSICNLENKGYVKLWIRYYGNQIGGIELTSKGSLKVNEFQHQNPLTITNKVKTC